MCACRERQGRYPLRFGHRDRCQLPLLFFSGLPQVRAAWRAGFPPSTVRQVSMALQCVQEVILSAETVPWLTTASQDPSRPPCLSIRPFRRFPVQCSVTYNAGPFLTLPLASCLGLGSRPDISLFAAPCLF
jgi:hypothetical protein